MKQLELEQARERELVGYVEHPNLTVFAASMLGLFGYWPLRAEYPLRLVLGMERYFQEIWKPVTAQPNSPEPTSSPSSP